MTEIRVAVDADEWYPVYSLSEDARDIEYATKQVAHYPTQLGVARIPVDLFERYRAAMAEFGAVRDILSTDVGKVAP